jgi:thioredoxin reductase (NADPH)
MKKLITSLLLLIGTTPLLAAKAPTASEQTQVVIIGSGVGSLTSALYLGRSGVKPIVIAGREPGGALAQSHSVQNWPGELDISGAELTEKMRKQAELSGAEFREAVVTKVDLASSPFQVYTEDIIDPSISHQIAAKSVIIAMGSTPKKLGIPGENTYLNKGVYTCALCDGPLFKDKVVGIVGGGDSALTEAHYLSRIAKTVHVFVRGKAFRTVDDARLKEVLSSSNVKVHFNTIVDKIDGNGEQITKVTTKTGNTNSTIALDGFFLAIGSTPNTALFKGQIDLDDQGYIALKNKQETSVKGVFAVGDITNGICKQAVCAAGDGALSTIQVEKYLAATDPLPIIRTANKASSETGYVIEITSEEQFNKEINKHTGPVVVDFYAPWCGPCKQLAPQLSNWAKEFAGKATFLKVNVDALPNLARIYKIQAMPTVILFNPQGSPVERKVGSQEIYDWMQKTRKSGSFNTSTY